MFLRQCVSRLHGYSNERELNSGDARPLFEYLQLLWWWYLSTGGRLDTKRGEQQRVEYLHAYREGCWELLLAGLLGLEDAIN